MSLAVLLDSALRENEDQPVQDDLASTCADAVITAISETPLRVEVFEKVTAIVMGEVLSIADIHVVLDALIEVLKGD